MPTNLAISDELINQAKRIGQHKTKKEAITAALQEYVRHREQLKILELQGQIDFDPDFDYRKLRGKEPW